jgi:hypothetical protein
MDRVNTRRIPTGILRMGTTIIRLFLGVGIIDIITAVTAALEGMVQIEPVSQLMRQCLSKIVWLPSAGKRLRRDYAAIFDHIIVGGIGLGAGENQLELRRRERGTNNSHQPSVPCSSLLNQMLISEYPPLRRVFFISRSASEPMLEYHHSGRSE